MARRFLICAVVLVAILPAVPVFAGPPFLTDDPEPVEYRHWEAYLFSTYDRSPDSTSVQGGVEINAGAAPQLQIHLVVPWAWTNPQDGTTQSGLGDTELGMKFRFLQETEHRPQVGIFPMAELPTGNAEKGLGNGKVFFKLPLWIQKSWGAWTTYGGGGWLVNHASGEQDHAFGGWLLQRQVSTAVTLGGEFFAMGADSEGGSGTAIANAGGVLNFSHGFSLLFSAGASFSGERHRVAYVGLYWTWGPAEPSESRDRAQPAAAGLCFSQAAVCR